MKGLDFEMSVCVNRITVGPIRTNCYIINRERNSEAVIIDPGDDADIIERKIKELRLEPVAILLTHGHFDHISATDTIRNHFGIKVYAYEKEKEVLNSDANLGTAFLGRKMRFEADGYLKDNDIINLANIEFRVIYTPGHTIGSCCYLAEGENVLFSGDTLFCNSHGRTDFPTGSESSIVHSITDRLFNLKDNIKVYPGHEEETSIGSEKRMNMWGM